MAMLEDFKQWAKKPFSADMDALHWFYFLGLLAVASIAWGAILGSLKRASS